MVNPSPRKRDPESTRTSILTSAEQLFVNKGFAATSMTDISAAAGVTKSLIHHHFGSKEDLWQEIKRHRVAEWVVVQKSLITGTNDSGNLVIKKSLENYFCFLLENPEFVRLSAWMSLEDPQLSQGVAPDLMALAAERIIKEQENGAIRRDVDARHILAMFLSLTTHWFLAHNQFSDAKLRTSQEREADRAYLEDMTRVFLAGLEPCDLD